MKNVIQYVKSYLQLTFIIIYITLVGCTTTREVYVPVVSNRTSTITVRDTVIVFNTEADSASVITADTTSTIHTSLATSSASIIDGHLHHSLYQLARNDSITASIPHQHTIDSVSYPVFVDKVIKKEVTPRWAWWTLAISLLTISFFIILFLTQIRK